MSGRTTWWPCDAAEHDRELIVELGEEFNADGPYLLRVLKDLAQAQRADGEVRSGFRVLRAKTFIDTPARVRQIIEKAAEIGALDDLVIDPDGRRFTCRVSGWMADQARGREAIKKAGQRARDATSVVPPEGDTSPGEVDVSPECPPTRPDQRRKNSPPNPPQAGGTPGGLPLRPGRTARTRDREAYERQLLAYAGEHFPDGDPPIVAGYVKAAIAQGIDDPERVAAWVRRWTQPSEPSIAELGARTVAFNAAAEEAA